MDTSEKLKYLRNLIDEISEAVFADDELRFDYAKSEIEGVLEDFWH